MSFRQKLLAGFLTLFAAVLGTALTVVSRTQRLQAERDTRAALSTTNDVFGALMDLRQRELTTSVGLLSGDFAFKRALATGDPNTVLSAARNLSNRIRADVMLVFDAEGGVLADTRGRKKDAAVAKIAEEALEGRALSRLTLLDGKPHQLAAVPVMAPDPIGAVVAGFRIDDELAQSLKNLTHSEVSFLAGGAVAASTLPEGVRADLAAALKAGGDAPIRAGGREWLAMADKKGQSVTAVVMRDWDEALEGARRLRRLLLLLGAAGLAVTALLGVAIASGLTSSLRKLSAATKLVAEGRYDLDLDIRSKDEVGTLGRAFTEMARGLKEREKIRSVLRKAVSKEIAESLLAQGQIELGGEEREMTILFSDIRSFTSFSETLAPKELVAQLNAYFTAMALPIESSRGVVDKYIGDAIMAIFGAPLNSPSHAAEAVRAALAMRAALGRLNQERAAAGLPAWETGIGLNTGSAVAGTLGSQDRWSYTVIGDSVNLASRLEGLTKRYGAAVLVSETTRRAAGDGFAFREVDEVVVKGRKEPVRIYEALCEGKGPAWLADYEAGMEACRAQKWDEAKRRFEAVLTAAPGDKAAADRLARANPEGQAPTVMTEKS